MTTEAETWLKAAPKKPGTDKVDITTVITEGQARGYCICPKPIRQMVNFQGLTCAWCGMPETDDSWAFWHRQIEHRND